VGIDAVLVTCDDHDIPSTIVIERAGGVLDDTGLAPNGTRTRRYRRLPISSGSRVRSRSPATDAGEGEVAENLRPFYIDYLQRHEVRAGLLVRLRGHGPAA
jgi:hypothetical protein